MIIAIDTSAIIAIGTSEPEAEAMVSAVGSSSGTLVSMATLFEAHCVSTRFPGTLDPAMLRELLETLELTPVSFDATQLDIARVAYLRYGRGSRHQAHLNMGDCFSYALAKSRNLPLLFKGEDFVHTDILPALSPR